MAKHKFNLKGLSYVVMAEDGFLQMYSPKGDLVTSNIFLRLQDGVHEPPTVIGKFRCNVVGSKEEMMQDIKENELGDWTEKADGLNDDKLN